PAKLAFVTARPGEPFAGKPSILLVFTEKNQSKEKQPEVKAARGELGSALVISLTEGGRIFGCQVIHSAHGKIPFNAIGSIRTSCVEGGDGRVEGEIQTDGEVKTSGKTWEVDLKFVAPLKAPDGKEVAAKADSKKSAAKEPGKKPAEKSDSDDEGEEEEGTDDE